VSKKRKPLNSRELAEKIAREIFSVGDGWSKTPIHRIAFMSGEYPSKEFPVCGLNEQSLTSVILRVLEVASRG
jgi:hypothetical protein